MNLLQHIDFGFDEKKNIFIMEEVLKRGSQEDKDSLLAMMIDFYSEQEEHSKESALLDDLAEERYNDAITLLQDIEKALDLNEPPKNKIKAIEKAMLDTFVEF